MSSTPCSSETELFGLVKSQLYTPVVGDILDRMGFTHQFLPQSIQPLLTEMKLVGRAMPTLMIDVHGPQKKPFGKLTEALDQLEPGDIFLASGGDMRCAYWGEILTATARTIALGLLESAARAEYEADAALGLADYPATAGDEVLAVVLNAVRRGEVRRHTTPLPPA